MKALFLYTELADYFIKCCEKLSASCDVHIVRWPVNKEAPFQFSFPKGITVYDKRDYSRSQLSDLVKKLQPDIIVCSGWIDKDYLSVTQNYFRRIPTVMSCDTKWKGSARQWFALILSRLTLKRIFSHAWVPGHRQERYVRKLGFKSVLKGFYSCDLDRFNTFFQVKDDSSPRRFIYAGRYYDFKGITDLWTAFMELDKEGNTKDWELWCLGVGDIDPIKHPKVKHLGFVQPKDIAPILKEGSVFVLPSRVEPWGVVVHEYAAAGFPLVLSTEVGAADAFMRENQNGYVFRAGDIADLKKALKKVIDLSTKELISMSECSHRLAQAITPEKWAASLVNVIYEGKKK